MARFSRISLPLLEGPPRTASSPTTLEVLPHLRQGHRDPRGASLRKRMQVPCQLRKRLEEDFALNKFYLFY